MKVEIINKKMLCWNSHEENAKEMLVLAKVSNCLSEFSFKAITSDGGFKIYKNAKHIPSVKNRTIEDGLDVGDIIENGNDERKILAICGNILIPSTDEKFNISGSNYTLYELINNGYKLKQPQEETEEQIIELSFKDISEGKGKGIPEHLIRIKDAQAE